MLNTIKNELHYGYRSMRLARNLIARRMIHANLQITYRCNFKCKICDFWKTTHDAAAELTLDDFRVIGRKLNQLGSLIISLAGGEPLIREDLPDIITILNESNHFPILITNGWFVDEDRAKAILNAGLQEISVSVDYADPDRHDEQRGQKGSWQKAIRALEILKKNRPGKRNRIHMISVLMDDNLDEIEKLIKLSRDMGITYMMSLYSWNRGVKSARLPGSSITEHLLSLKKQYPEFISLTSYIEQFDKAIADGGIGNCQTGRLLMNIDNRGLVARCTETLDEPVGNILTDSMETIQNRLFKLQESSTCSQCWTSCRGFAECMYTPPRLRQFKEFLNSVRPY